MGLAKSQSGRRRSSRFEGRFVGIPVDVLESSAYIGLSHPAKALLLDIAWQYRGRNNGCLLTSLKFLKLRGWKSADVVDRAKSQLIGSKLIYQTVQGHRPNKASWYAITWHALDANDRYDYGAAAGFKRGAYRDLKINVLSPSGGTKPVCIVPSAGD
jgi:hypothetical protein